jgi:cytidylate kinase
MVIAIDGLSSCGKSTLARDLAAALEYTYVDSGAMYRAVTLYFLNNDIDINDEKAVSAALSQIDIHFSRDRILLNEEDVSEKIRTQEVAQMVSPVATLTDVRRRLVELQRGYSKGGDLVMDGRDIGSVVFPDADLKIFVKADLNVRTERRYQELLNKGVTITREDVSRNLQKRDHIDSTREDSPLVIAKEAKILDTTYHTRESQLKEVLSWIKQ